MRIGVVSKRRGELPYRIVRDIISYGRELGLDVLVEDSVAKDIGWDRTFAVDTDRVDFLVVVGGDGTLLRAIQRLRYVDTPIVGVRAGRRGFLLDVEPQEVQKVLRDLVEGRYRVYEYMRLEASVGERLFYALNDVVVASAREDVSRAISLRIEIDGEPLYEFDGDGVIVATPLGSTAYAFSAGGPIVDADIEAIVVAPLVPIQAHAKPVVLSSSKVVGVVNVGEDEALCIVDGYTVARVKPGERVVVKRAEMGVRFVRFREFKTYRRVQVCEF